MALLFDDAATQYVQNVVSCPITTYPFTLSAWVYSDSLLVNQAVIWIGDKDAATHWCNINLRGAAAGDFVRAMTQGYGLGWTAVDTLVPYTINAWNHVCGVWDNNASRHIYLNGANKQSSVVAVGAMANHDACSIGYSIDTTPAGPFSGRIAEATIWNASLDDDEVAALATGIWSFRMRPGNIVAYWPLWGLHSPEIDCSLGARQMTLVNGPVLANHAPVAPFIGSSAARHLRGLVPPLAMSHYNRRRSTNMTLGG